MSEGCDMSEKLKPVMEGIFEEGSPPMLVGGQCVACNRNYFPKPMVCPQCLGPVVPRPLSTKGILYSFTIIRIKAPFGLPQPYSVGYVDLTEDKLRIITLLDPDRIDQLTIGKSVDLCIGPLGLDRFGQPCLRYYFSPAPNGGIR